jgi:capsular polysaccharide biosynthesis protein
MPEGLKPYQRSSIAHAMPSNVQLLCLAPQTWVHAERWVFPSFVTWKANGFIPRPHLDWLRQRIFSSLNLKENEPSRRIYISRQKAKGRRVRNEAAVVEMLQGWGFEWVTLEEMPFEEQVKLFHSAEIVVGPHGAGFSNLLFSGQIKVIDLLPSWSPATHFFFLAQSLGQKYSYVRAHSTPEVGEFDVNITELKKLLEL